VQDNGGGYVNAVTDVITGKTTGKYQRAYRIPLTGTGPWDIKMSRITADSGSVSLQNATYFDSYIEIITTKFTYPNSAIIGMSFDSAQFSNVPSRAFDVKLLKVQIPSNYDPVTRTYTGSWDGTFDVAWTDNPAWCFYDLVTNARYGLGNYIPAELTDKWALYTIGQYCDVLVPDGFGGMEPRFTCNIYIQSPQEAYKVANDFTSIFRGMAYWAAGSLTVTQDSPADAVYLYTAANVIDGMFVYQGSSLSVRHTVALVTYNDPNNFYQQAVEYVEDVVGIADFGYVTTQVIAIGCTSRGQAHRLGKWILLSERIEGETVTFRTGLDGMIARPGQVIKVADPARAAVRLGGRLTAATSTSITLDSPVTLESGHIYTLSLIAPDATVMDNLPISNAAGVASVITLPTALAQTPQVNAIWILQSDQVEAQLFRVVQAAETEGNVEITALVYNPDKYEAIENNLLLENATNLTSISPLPRTPANITVTEFLYNDTGGVKSGLILSWDIVEGATRYVVQYQRSNENWQYPPELNTSSVEILDTHRGTYVFKVYSVNPEGARSIPGTATVTVYGKNAPPADVTGLNFVAAQEVAHLTWDAHPDLDVQIGGSIVVKHTPAILGVSWNMGVKIAQFAGNVTSGTVQLMNGTYMIKAVDSSGNWSINPAIAETNTASMIPFTTVATVQEDPDFIHTKSNVVVTDFGMIIGDTVNYSTGSYTFAGADLGAVYKSKYTATIQAEAYTGIAQFIDDRTDPIDEWADIDGQTDYIDDRTDPIDEWELIDGSVINNTGVILYISTTNDDPAGSPVWSDYTRFFSGYYTARAARYRLDFYTDQPVHNIAVTQLRIDASMPVRTETASGVLTLAAGSTITFANAFNSTPTVVITGLNLASGDTWTLTSITTTSFQIRFFNSSGTGVARTFNWAATGVGYNVT
jgi:predicted phage tail protein